MSDFELQEDGTPTSALPDKNSELDLTANKYRDENGNEFTQVFYTCKCGRGGWLRLPYHVDVEALVSTHTTALLDRVKKEVIGADIKMNFRVEDPNFEKRRFAEDKLNGLQRVQRNRLSQIRKELL